MGRNTKSRARIARFSALIAIAALAAASASSCKTAPDTRAAGGALQGIVFDLDKSPVPGAVIEMPGSGGDFKATTDAQGRFSIPGIEAGEYAIGFSKAMYETSRRSVLIGGFAEVLYLQVASYWQLLDAALSALGKKELGEAEDYLARAKTIQEESATSLFLDGVLAEKRGDYALAVHALERAVEIDSRSAYLWLYLADLYEKSGAESDKLIRTLDAYLNLRDDPAAAERRASLH